MPSAPEVTIVSSTFKSARFDTSSRRRGFFQARPGRPPCRRLSCARSSAPAAACRSMMSCTRAACAAGDPTTRPTMPVGAMTAMFSCTPSAEPRSMVTDCIPGFGFPAITSAGSVGVDTVARRFNSSCSFVVRAARARCSCSRTSSSATCFRSVSFSDRTPRRST